MNLHSIYIVHYTPNCEEDYIVYISFSKKNCEIFIKKHTDSSTFRKSKYYCYQDLHIKKYTLEHWYKL